MMDQTLLLTIAIIAVTVIITDYRFQRIPNGVTFPTMVCAVLYHSLMTGQSGLLFSLSGLLIGIAILFIPYLMGGVGAGDVKLLGALGALTGPSGVILVTLYAALVGGVYAIGFLFFDKHYRKRFLLKHFSMIKNYFLFRQFAPDDMAIVHNGPKLCYGIAIAIGAYVYISEAFFGFTILSNSIFA
jgi:prepilin peptidase CpaA